MADVARTVAFADKWKCPVLEHMKCPVVSLPSRGVRAPREGSVATGAGSGPRPSCHPLQELRARLAIGTKALLSSAGVRRNSALNAGV